MKFPLIGKKKIPKEHIIKPIPKPFPLNLTGEQWNQLTKEGKLKFWEKVTNKELKAEELAIPNMSHLIFYLKDCIKSMNYLIHRQEWEIVYTHKSMALISVSETLLIALWEAVKQTYKI